MYDNYLTFRSLTGAQRALVVCRERGIRAELVRTPKGLSVRGCGYGLQMDRLDLEHVALELRLRGIPFEHGYQIAPSGSVEEVFV